MSVLTLLGAEEVGRIKSLSLKILTATIGDCPTDSSISAAKVDKMAPKETTIRPMASRRSERRTDKRTSLSRSM